MLKVRIENNDDHHGWEFLINKIGFYDGRKQELYVPLDYMIYTEKEEENESVTVYAESVSGYSENVTVYTERGWTSFHYTTIEVDGVKFDAVPFSSCYYDLSLIDQFPLVKGQLYKLTNEGMNYTCLDSFDSVVFVKRVLSFDHIQVCSAFYDSELTTRDLKLEDDITSFSQYMKPIDNYKVEN